MGFNRTLKRGHQGDDVKELQRLLHMYGLKDDGIFGQITEAAVINFQKLNGLEPDGVVGPKTIHALGAGIVDEGQDEGTRDWYRRQWSRLALDKGYEEQIANDAKGRLPFRSRYETVGEQLGIPWYVIAGIHMKEASGNFNGCLANGQKIIGTGEKTTIVPKGLGPYATWEESAVDILTRKGWNKIKDWEIGNQLYYVERYNGTGYISGAGKAETSPYLWARTNINDDFGKYVSDGRFDATAPTNKTSGYCALLKWWIDNGHAYVLNVSTPADKQPEEVKPKPDENQVDVKPEPGVIKPQYWKPLVINGVNVHPIFEVPAPYTHLHPIDILRSVAGEKEVKGKVDNVLIAHFHEHSPNLAKEETGGKEDAKNNYHDEVPHCMSAQNWAQDGAGCYKSDTALAAAGEKYAKKHGSRAYRKGEWIPEGALICIDGHITRANKKFQWTGKGTFEGFGSNQGNTIKTSTYDQKRIRTICADAPKPGTVLAPIGILGHKPVPTSGNGQNESTR